jgi:P4 family phage/plasmid primase-like protien
VESGFYDDVVLMAKAALRLTEHAKGVYFTLNSLKEDLLARRSNRVDYAGSGELASDGDVLRRHLLPIDVDPTRDPHVSATEEEKQAAREVTWAVREFLRGRGWPEPILVDSGNGFYLLYRIDLPADDGGLVARVLAALASSFDCAEAHVDLSVANAARIVKVPGTWARKGDDVPGRPHRVSCVLADDLRTPRYDVSGLDPQVVPEALLRALGGKAEEGPAQTKPGAASRNGKAGGHRLLVGKYLDDHGVAYRLKDQPDSKGRIVYVLQQCPFDPAHGDPDACVMQAADGQLSAHCFHASCAGRGWREFKVAIGEPDPHHFDPPLRRGWEARGGQGAPVTRERPGPPPADADATLGPVNEAADDPHRLARLFLADHATKDGPAVRWWREEFHRWDRFAYRVLPDKEVRAELAERIKREFDRIHRLALWEKEKEDADAEASGIEGEKSKPPVARKVTTRLLADVTLALSGMTLLPGTVEQPSWLTDDEPFTPEHVLACNNTLLHLPSLADGLERCQHPLTPAFFSPNALNYDYDPAAPPPDDWLRFLDQLWPGDQQAVDTLQEWFGYCLLPDTRHHKMLFVAGPKRSGKGTIARVLRELVGDRNACAPTLAGMGTNFGMAPLLGKTLAVISDARLSGRSDAAVVVERLLSISGEDAQTIDRKNRSHVTTRLPVRFVILTNELPRLSDASGALVGRLIVLRMTQSWFGREDTGLTQRLLGELPGILLWALEGWKRLRARGRFLQPESGGQLVRDLEDLSSPIGAFVRERCEVGPGYEEQVKDLYRAWKGWCEDKGKEHPGDEQTFGRNLRAALPGIDDHRRRIGGQQVRYYAGVRLCPLKEDSGPIKTPFE